MAEDERPQSITVEGPVEIRIENELLPFVQTLLDPQGNPVIASGGGSGVANVATLVRGRTLAGADEPIALENDRTTRGQVLLWDYTGAQQIRAAGEAATGEARTVPLGWDGAALIRHLCEADGSHRNQNVLWDFAGGGPIRWAGEPVSGEARISNYGWNGAALTQFLLEATGEQRTTLVGADEGGNLDTQRTDPNRVPWKRDYPAYVQVDPVVLANADGLLWNPGAVAAELYEVSFLLVNIAGAATGAIDVGVDIAAGGALGGGEFWVRQEIIPNPGTSGWRGPFIIAGDDDVRGWCAGAANQVCIHFRIRRVDVGA